MSGHQSETFWSEDYVEASHPSTVPQGQMSLQQMSIEQLTPRPGQFHQLPVPTFPQYGVGYGGFGGNVNYPTRGYPPYPPAAPIPAPLPAPGVQTPYGSFGERQYYHPFSYGPVQPEIPQQLGVVYPSFNSNECAFQGSNVNTTAFQSAADEYSGFDDAREIGRLEEKVARLQTRIEFQEREIGRYKQERDQCRKDYEASALRVANLTGQIHAMKIKANQLPRAESPITLFQMPKDKPTMPMEKMETSPISDGVSSIFPHLMRSPPPMTPPDSPETQVALASRGNIGEVLARYFAMLVDWAETYATATVAAPLKNIESMKDLWQFISVKISKGTGVDDLLQSPDLRPFLVVAIVNHYLLPFLGCDFFQKVEQLANHGELLEMKDELQRVAPFEASRCHQILKRRSATLKQLFSAHEFKQILNHQMYKLTEEIMFLVECLIPEAGVESAKTNLKDLLADGFRIGQRMMLIPIDWSIFMGQRYDRWDPYCMIQKDSSIKDDPVLTENHGFGYIVRMGVLPTVTEKDYSGGVLKVKEVHPKTVLLMENYSRGHAPGRF